MRVVICPGLLRLCKVCERHLILAVQQILIATALLAIFALSSYAQLAAANTTTEEPLEEKVNDPTATLSQIQIKNIYTPAEYSTNAQTEYGANPSHFRDSCFLVNPFRTTHSPYV